MPGSSRWPIARRRSSALAVGVAVLAVLGGLAAGAQRGLPTSARPVTLAAGGGNAPAATSLVTSTFLGDVLWDEATDVEGDAAGNTFVTGFTMSPSFPVRDAAQPEPGGLVDAFVAKYGPDGALVWSTYLGGGDVDVANSLALDVAGNLYVTGRTGSDDFPTRGAAQPALNGLGCQGEPCHDAFVTKLDGNGVIAYSTFLGGTNNEEGVGVAVDRAGSAYVTGNTDSPDLPTRAAVQPTFGSSCPGDLPCPYDVFVAKLSSDGSELVYSTYLGGRGPDTSGGVTVDASGSAYVTGSTRSADYPTAGALQGAVAGLACGPPPGVPCLDAFVTKLSSGGDALVYSTLFGGTSNERGTGVAVGSDGSAVITGSTQSRDLPTANPLQAALDNRSCTSDEPQEQCNDGFVAKLDPTATSLTYSTYLGGAAEDQGLAVAVDDQGNATVVGRTDSRNFPVLAAVQPTFGGYIDGFATSLTPDGALRWSTFLGGAKADRVEGVSVDAALRVRLAGRTLSTDFPTARPAQAALHDPDDYDAFVTTIE